MTEAINYLITKTVQMNFLTNQLIYLSLQLSNLNFKAPNNKAG